MIKCTICKESKEIIYFTKNKSRKNGIENYCKNCKSKMSLKYQNSIKGKNTIREAHLKRKYNLTLNEYNNMLNLQNNKCKICLNNNLDKRAKHLVVDHNHDNGNIRGLLCTKCNAMIGLANDEINLLFSAIDYLNSYKTI